MSYLLIRSTILVPLCFVCVHKFVHSEDMKNIVNNCLIIESIKAQLASCLLLPHVFANRRWCVLCHYGLFLILLHIQTDFTFANNCKIIKRSEKLLSCGVNKPIVMQVFIDLNVVSKTVAAIVPLSQHFFWGRAHVDRIHVKNLF